MRYCCHSSSELVTFSSTHPTNFSHAWRSPSIWKNPFYCGFIRLYVCIYSISAGGIQSKRTTELRSENQYYQRIDSDVLQRNLTKLDAAFTGFWSHKRGFPAYRQAANFKSFEYKPGRCKFDKNRVYLPGIGWMRYFNSRPFPKDAEIRTVTVIQKGTYWFISALVDIKTERPKLIEPKSCLGIDVGINKLLRFVSAQMDSLIAWSVSGARELTP